MHLCVEKHENTNGCILWERNMNASRNIIKMMRNITINKTRGKFIKKKSENKNNVKLISKPRIKSILNELEVSIDIVKTDVS